MMVVGGNKTEAHGARECATVSGQARVHVRFVSYCLSR